MRRYDDPVEVRSEEPAAPGAVLARSRQPGDLLGERVLRRVETGRGPVSDGGGVLDWDDGHRELVGCAD